VSSARVERDLLGTRELPADSLFGIHAARAVDNFRAPGPRLRDVPEFATALAMVKLAAARANRDCGRLAPEVADAIGRACTEIVDDVAGMREHLVVPLLQGGAGTSTNMNVNEVIANRALQLLGHDPGEYEFCHPNDHVNRSQSTNDVYPTALRVALLLRDAGPRGALTRLAEALDGRADAYAQLPKLGRTQLRDAVPMTVGQEFRAWADACRSAVSRLHGARDPLLTVNLGGTAIGTGLGAPDGFSWRAAQHLTTIAGLPLRPALRPVSATTDGSALLGYCAAVRAAAVCLSKLANDLRLLSSGPRAGLGELDLPAVQAGSSMMPGKVNPVIPEYVNQLCFRIYGHDLAVAMALDAGQLQLNAMVPTVAFALFEAQTLLEEASTALTERCVEGISVQEQRVREYAGQGLGELSVAASVLGYEHTSDLAAEAARAGLSPVEAVRSTRD
jgi:aspartate ammonia-lyase